MSTIKDVAREADVSIATVSMVLNNRAGISNATSKKVKEAAQRLGYVTSASQKNVPRSGTIGLITGDVTNPFFPEVIKGAYDAARKFEYSISFSIQSADSEDAIRSIDEMVTSGVNGLFICGVQKYTPEFSKKLEATMKSGIPVVGNGKSYAHTGVPYIEVNEAPLIDTLLTKLVGYGHKKIGFVGGTEDFWVTRSRLEMFQECLEQYGLYNQELIALNGHTVEQAQAVTTKLLVQHPEITALMCMDDIIAIGSMLAARDLGREVPKQLSLFGVDGIAATNYFPTHITTIDAQRYELGYRGVEWLVAFIEGNTSAGSYGQGMVQKVEPSILWGDTIGIPVDKLNQERIV